MDTLTCTYEFTTVGGTATVWQGSVFKYPSSQNSVSLIHSCSNNTKTCNGAAISGRVEDKITSQCQCQSMWCLYISSTLWSTDQLLWVLLNQ